MKWYIIKLSVPVCKYFDYNFRVYESILKFSGTRNTIVYLSGFQNKS